LIVQTIHNQIEILIDLNKTDSFISFLKQMNMFEYLECLMNGLKKIGRDDIETPRQNSIDSELLCMYHILI
jgi:hypothetical protein